MSGDGHSHMQYGMLSLNRDGSKRQDGDEDGGQSGSVPSESTAGSDAEDLLFDEPPPVAADVENPADEWIDDAEAATPASATPQPGLPARVGHDDDWAPVEEAPIDPGIAGATAHHATVPAGAPDPAATTPPPSSKRYAGAEPAASETKPPAPPAKPDSEVVPAFASQASPPVPAARRVPPRRTPPGQRPQTADPVPVVRPGGRGPVAVAGPRRGSLLVPLLVMVTGLGAAAYLALIERTLPLASVALVLGLLGSLFLAVLLRR